MAEEKKTNNIGLKWVVILSVLLVVLIIMNLAYDRVFPAGKEKTLNVQTLRDLSQLATVEFHLKKIVRFKDSTILGNRRLLVEMPAVVKAGIDLSKLSDEDIEQNGDSITLRLPGPEILDLIIDMRNIREVINETALFRGDFTPEERNEYLRQGEESLREYVETGRIGVLKASENNTRILLSAWLKRLGFSDIKIIIGSGNRNSAKRDEGGAK